MNRMVLIIGSLDGEFELLRQLMLDVDCSAIQFTEPDRWRDSLGPNELGAAVISRSVCPSVRERVRWEMHSFEPTARIVLLEEQGPTVYLNGSSPHG